jgi:hypothetical protein
MNKTYLSGRAAALSPEGHFIARSAFILLLWCCPALLAAEGNGVKVSNLSVSAGTVTFTVSWKSADMPTLWSDTVWVFVDYNDNGKMERLPVTGATASAGTVKKEPNNDKGVWVVGNARTAGAGGFSATVKLLTAVKDVAGICAYASNYPPVGKYISSETVKFTGTPPYDLTLNTGTDQAYGNYNLLSGQTLDAFTDKTGAPGIIHCLAPAPPTVVNATFCFGLPGQLQAASSGGATIVWYDAPTAGKVLYTGNILPLTPLYNSTTQYYAEAVSETNCPSVRRIAANYSVNHCVLNGYCPGFEAGSVGSGLVAEAACSTFDSGRIGLVSYQAACETFYPGQIGITAYPTACVSFDAGHIGK